MVEAVGKYRQLVDVREVVEAICRNLEGRKAP